MRAAQAAVRQSNQLNVRLAFGDITDTTVEALPDRKWRVSGWVDYIDQYGPARQNYSLLMYRSSTGLWTSQDLFIAPQLNIQAPKRK